MTPPRTLSTTDYQDARDAAETMLAEVGLAGCERPCVLDIAEGLGVPVSFVEGRYLVGRIADGVFDTRTKTYRVFCRNGPLDSVRRFRIAHELGHYAWRMRHAGPVRDGAFIEAWCNAFAGALLVRSEALRVAWSAFRRVQAILRRWAHLPPTAVALRIGEEQLAAVWITQRTGVRYDRDLIASGRRRTDILMLGERAVSRGSYQFPQFQGRRLADGIRRATVVYTP